MANADSVKAKIRGLIDTANGVTGNADTTLTDAVEALAAGYGQGTDPILTDITITENGEYTPDEGVDGFNRVTVEVESGGGVPELVYETEFSVAESIHNNTETTLATLETGLTEADYNTDMLYLVAIRCVNDTETDMSFSHFRERVQTMATPDGGYPVASLQSGVVYYYDAAQARNYSYHGAKGGVYVSGSNKWMTNIYVKAFGSGNSGGFAVSGDYSLKLYKIDTAFFGLEGLV